jgi:cytochrome c oxidase assembly factor CtaG/putative copper export protein
VISTAGRTPRGTTEGRGRLARVVAWAVLVAAGAAVAALILGGGRPTAPPPGLPDPGRLTEWALPAARLTANLAAVLTIGFLLAAAGLIASRHGGLSTPATRATRIASRAALVWMLSALAMLVLTLADILAVPVTQAVSPSQLISYVSQIPQGGAWATVAVLAAVTAVAARESRSTGSVWLAFAVAVVALLPPALTGHAANLGDHDVATSALVMHIVAVVVWVGGLLALVWYATGAGRDLGLAARRFSTLAGWAYAAVGLSGVVSAAIRLSAPSQLWTTGYGQLIAAKAVLFVILGIMGRWHRTTTLAEIDAGRPRAFIRLATSEVLVMAATIGVAVALSRTPPPPGTGSAPDAATVALGFAMPPPPTLLRYLTLWRWDVLVFSVVGLCAYFYLRWYVRLRRRSDTWPAWRLLMWLLGLLIALFGATSGVATYGRVMFSAHMTQHMLLSMMAPLFLVMGAPITLALRALPAAGSGQPRGAREHLLTMLHSPITRVLTHPVVALVLFISAPYMIYFSNLFETAMRNHWAHEAMHVHFVLVGYLFYESLIGTDPLPHRAPYPIRTVALLVSMPFHAFFAIALMSSRGVIASSYYALVNPSWAPNRLLDQTHGAAFAWAFGELPSLIAMLVLLLQWSNADTREARRHDRAADRDGDADLAAYNKMLAARARASRTDE